VTNHLSRKERRASSSKASNVYGLEGKNARILEHAYRAVRNGDLDVAVKLALKLSQIRPNNVHPWLILGAAAVEQREGETAGIFYDRALEIDAGSPIAIAGKGKGHFLLAEVFQAVDYFEAAIIAGSKDIAMAKIYSSLMDRLNRHSAAAEHLSIIAEKSKNSSLWHDCGEMYVAAGKLEQAGEAFGRAFLLDQDKPVFQAGQAKSLIFNHAYQNAKDYLEKLMQATSDNDELPVLYMMALRNLGEFDEVIKLVDYDFIRPKFYQSALAQAAYAHMDKGNLDLAENYLREAMCVDDFNQGVMKKSLASFLFLQGEFSEGATHYNARNANNICRDLSFNSMNSLVSEEKDQVYIRAEQGIGDQLALLPLIGMFRENSTILNTTFVGEKRMEAVIAGCKFPISFCHENKFTGIAKKLSSDQICFLGDLMHLVGEAPKSMENLGGYINIPFDRTSQIRNRYAELSNGRPTIGLAWQSRECLTGFHRSIPFSQIIMALPSNVFVVNLQYGDCKQEMRMAKKLRPDITFYQDEKVDQFADLMTFLDQISAVDHVVTIDNTTAHACGAIGHRETHLLLPLGAECMWYWGRNKGIDPWYSCLHLYRQEVAQDWTAPLEMIHGKLSSL
jgi:Flp pilus assembly protein TadD